MKNFINLTPHAITLNNGTTFPPSGKVARIETKHTEFNDDLICQVQFGEPVNIPEPVENTFYIVSGLMLSALPNRKDLVAPATGHPECKRNEKGHIVSVPGFVQ